LRAPKPKTQNQNPKEEAGIRQPLLLQYLGKYRPYLLKDFELPDRMYYGCAKRGWHGQPLFAYIYGECIGRILIGLLREIMLLE
jgi:hypothetical protein